MPGRSMVIAVCLALGISPGLAKEDTITLEQVLRGALRPDNISTLMQDENVKSAAGHLQQARGTFDWNVNTQAGLQRLYVARAINGVLTNQTQLISSLYYSANIGREFRNGIQINPGITAYPLTAGTTPAQTYGLTQLRPSLGLKIPILRGLGEEEADAGERSAKDAYYGARQSRTFAVSQTIQTDVQTFWRCLALDQIAVIAENSDRNTADYQKSLEKQVQRGLLEPTTAQQAAATNLQQHLDAEKARETASVCLRDLAYATTGSADGPYANPSGDLPEVEPMADAIKRLNTDALIQLALTQRSDIKAARNNVDAAEESLVSAHSATAPELDLHVDPLSVIATYSQSIQNNTAEGLEAQASAAKSQAELTLRQLQDQAHIDVSDAVRNLQRDVSDWNSLVAAERQMHQVVSDADKRARYGSITWADFLAAENQLAQIQQVKINVRLDFANSLAALRLVTGTIELDSETPASLATKFVTLPAA